MKKCLTFANGNIYFTKIYERSCNLVESLLIFYIINSTIMSKHNFKLIFDCLIKIWWSCSKAIHLYHPLSFIIKWLIEHLLFRTWRHRIIKNILNIIIKIRWSINRYFGEDFHQKVQHIDRCLTLFSFYYVDFIIY